jgi:hypothetical protein
MQRVIEASQYLCKEDAWWDVLVAQATGEMLAKVESWQAHD